MKRSDNTTRILLADEHRLVRSAISSLIETFDKMTVVAEVGSEQQLISEVANQDMDVALIDAAVVSLKGVELLAQLTSLCPTLRIVILSSYSSDSYIHRLFEAGICGLLHKNADVAALKAAIQKAARGEQFMLTAMEPEHFVSVASWLGVKAPHDNPLTARQCEVLQLVAQGFRSKAIADQLNVSIKTIETHRADIMRRLGVRHMAGLVHEAIRLGLLASPHDTGESV